MSHACFGPFDFRNKVFRTSLVSTSYDMTSKWHNRMLVHSITSHGLGQVTFYGLWPVVVTSKGFWVVKPFTKPRQH